MWTLVDPRYKQYERPVLQDDEIGVERAAAVVALGYIDGLLALLIAYLPLAVLAVRFRAGQLESA